jgi:NADH-quinone oxidoreductase subunit E
MVTRRLAPEQPESFAFTAKNENWARQQIRKYPEGREASAVIPLLWKAQEQHDGWLPEPAIRLVAEMLGMSYIRALEVATFYTMFNLAPVGAHFVQLCGTTPCMLRGAEELKEVCRRVIGPEHHVSADGRLSWLEVECLGACVNAPMAQINHDYFEDLTPQRFEEILEALRRGEHVEPGPQVDRQLSAPVGGLTTLLDESIYQGRHEAHPEEQPAETGSAVDTMEDPRADLAAKPPGAGRPRAGALDEPEKVDRLAPAVPGEPGRSITDHAATRQPQQRNQQGEPVLKGDEDAAVTHPADMPKGERAPRRGRSRKSAEDGDKGQE